MGSNSCCDNGRFNDLLCRLMAVVVCVCLASGCTTLHPVVPAEPRNVLSEIKPGDSVRVITRQGQELEFFVREATEQNLVGEVEQVKISDVTSIERRDFHLGKTMIFLGAATTVAVLAWATYFFAAFAGY